MNTVPAVVTAKTDSQPTYQRPSDRSLGFGCHGKDICDPQCDSESPDSHGARAQHKEKKHSHRCARQHAYFGHWIPELAIGGMVTLQIGAFPFPTESIFLAYDCLMY